jgi:hypothetical protein
MFVCCCCCWLHYPQAEELYNLADQYGIMIWVDSMFACAQYPNSQAFLSNVAAETTQQVILLVMRSRLGDQTLAIGSNNSSSGGGSSRGHLAGHADGCGQALSTCHAQIAEQLTESCAHGSSSARGSQPHVCHGSSSSSGGRRG